MLNQISCTALENEEFIDHYFILYPNPAKAILNIQNSLNTCIEKIIITYLLGKKILEQSGNSNMINVQNLQQGMYLLELYYEGGKQIDKFIKE